MFKSDIFISYSRRDLAQVLQLKEALEHEVGVKPWIDLNGIETGDQFGDVIVSAIDNCKVVLFAVSESSMKSPWTKKEVSYAANIGKKICPVLLQGGKLGGWFLFEFGTIDCIDYQDARQREKLFRNLRTWTSEGAAVPEEPAPAAPAAPRSAEEEHAEALRELEQELEACRREHDAAESHVASCARNQSLALEAQKKLALWQGTLQKLGEEIRPFELPEGCYVAGLTDAIHHDYKEGIVHFVEETDARVASYRDRIQKAGAELAARLERAKAGLRGKTAELLVLEQRLERLRGGSGAVRPGALRSISLPRGGTLDLVYCPPGAFTMGSPLGEAGREDNETQREVTITHGFWMSRYPVTQGQWWNVMGANPARFKGDDNPVESVSWEDCQVFLAKLNESMPALKARLPTEAEWEYACRAGTEGPYDGRESPEALGWYAANSGSELHRVGTREPNAWGLGDMHGNVWEWCQDYFGSYDPSATVDPQGPARGDLRVGRGGCWGESERFCRAACRGKGLPRDKDIFTGFRICCA